MKQLDTPTEFNKALENAGDSLVLVDFYATWCGPCKRIAPFIEKLQDEYPTVRFYKVNVDTNKEIAEFDNITGMPTFICYKNERYVNRVVGANMSQIREMLNKHK